MAALADAFLDDPAMTWIIGPKVDRTPRLRALFANSLRSELAKPHHIVDVAADAQAVALWHDVDDWKTPNRQVLKMVPRAFDAFRWRLPQALRVLSAMESVHPEAPHRYLGFIGVHRSHQGTGLGGALLGSMLDECDELGLPAYLESSNPANDALYHRFGFVTTGPIPLPKGAPVISAMWRDPR